MEAPKRVRTRKSRISKTERELEGDKGPKKNGNLEERRVFAVDSKEEPDRTSLIKIENNLFVSFQIRYGC